MVEPRPGSGQRAVRAGGVCALLSGGALLCAACNAPPPCWNLHEGQQFAIELVALYTSSSSFTYQSVTVRDSNTPSALDSLYPPCGPDFDFRVGDTLHATVKDVDGVDEDPQQCLESSFVIDSPMRSVLTSQVTGGHGLLPLEGYAREFDQIQVNGCPAARRMELVPMPGHSGLVQDPVPGSVPAVVLVRLAGLSCLANGQSATCGDQFVVRLTRQ